MPTPHVSSKSAQTTYKPSTSRNGSAAGAGTLAAWMRVSEEATRFASQRLEKNIETARTLSRCTSPIEMWTTWTEAAQTLARDYAESFVRMGETYVDAATSAQKDMVEASRSKTRSAGAQAV